MDGNAQFCPFCGTAIQSGEPAPAMAAGRPAYSEPRTAPSNHLVLSILTTLLCCMPFGIVAIIYSSKVDSAIASGSYDIAENMSKKAKMWSLIGIGCCVIGVVIYLLILLLMILIGTDSSVLLDSFTI